MRRVLYGDVSAAARALLTAPPGARDRLLARMLTEADAAEVYRRDTGRVHPLWGTGSLMSAALAHAVAPEPHLDDPDYAACMALVFKALAARSGQGTGDGPAATRCA